jgi:hypothetical protein
MMANVFKIITVATPLKYTFRMFVLHVSCLEQVTHQVKLTLCLSTTMLRCVSAGTASHDRILRRKTPATHTRTHAQLLPTVMSKRPHVLTSDWTLWLFQGTITPGEPAPDHPPHTPQSN